MDTTFFTEGLVVVATLVLIAFVVFCFYIFAMEDIIDKIAKKLFPTITIDDESHFTIGGVFAIMICIALAFPITQTDYIREGEVLTLYRGGILTEPGFSYGDNTKHRIQISKFQLNFPHNKVIEVYKNGIQTHLDFVATASISAKLADMLYSTDKLAMPPSDLNKIFLQTVEMANEEASSKHGDDINYASDEFRPAVEQNMRQILQNFLKMQDLPSKSVESFYIHSLQFSVDIP